MFFHESPEERNEREREERERYAYIGGLDLGEVNDWTALAIIRADFGINPLEPTLSVVHLERYRHKLYPDVAREVYQRMMRPPLWGQSDLVVDSTGVGRAVTDIYSKVNIPFTGVTIHGGVKEKFDEKTGYWNVPKSTLVAAAMLPFQNRRMKIARALPLAGTLKAELQGFRLKQNIKTGHETFSHREGEHDDLVLAVALACWGAMRLPGGDVHEDLAEVADPYRPNDHLAGIPSVETLDDMWRW